MRTTNKQFKMQVQEHILNSLSEDYTEIQSEQLKNVVDAFNNWYSPYEQKRTPNKLVAFKEFLLGLPSEISIEYSYYNIGLTLEAWFENCGEVYVKRDSDKEAELYYHLVTREFIALCHKNNIDF